MHQLTRALFAWKTGDSIRTYELKLPGQLPGSVLRSRSTLRISQVIQHFEHRFPRLQQNIQEQLQKRYAKVREDEEEFSGYVSCYICGDT
jgi:hypothetical protein